MPNWSVRLPTMRRRNHLETEPASRRPFEARRIAIPGASGKERDIFALERLATTRQEKADALAPLVAALRRRQGDVVNAPAEVCAVAEDICKEIESGYESRGYFVIHWLI